MVIFAKGVHHVRNKLPGILENWKNPLTPRIRELLNRHYQHFVELDKELSWHDQQLATQSKTDEVCQRLVW